MEPLAQQAPDRAHGRDKASLFVVGQSSEYCGHLLLRADFKFTENLMPFSGQGQARPPGVGRARGPFNEILPLEALEHPAQISLIEFQLPGQLGRGRPVAVRDLVQHASLGQGERALQQAFVQNADVLRIEPVEAAAVSTRCSRLISNILMTLPSAVWMLAMLKRILDLVK